MDVKVRNLSPTAVKHIDRLAKENGYKSRNAYLKNLLEDLSFLKINNANSDRLEKQLQANTLFLEKASESFDALTSVMKELISHE